MVFISGEYPPDVGGVADYTHHLARAITHLGHEAVVVTGSSRRGPGRETQSEDAIPVRAAAGSWRVTDAAATAKAVAGMRPDVINLQYVPQMYGRGGVAPGAAILPWMLRRACGALLVCTMHEIASPCERRPRRMAAALAHRAQALLIAAACDRVIVTNAAYARTMRRWTGGRRRIYEIPVGASVMPSSATEAAIAQLRASLGAGDGFLIGEFSPLGAGKRPEHLVTLARAIGQKARLVMLGGLGADAQCRDTFTRGAKAAGVAERFIWTGPLPAAGISHHLAALDVYVHTHGAGASGRSTTLMSALAHRLPVVAFNGPETTAPLAHEGVALVPDGDTASFVRRVEELIAAPSARARAAGEARDVYERHFAWGSIAGRLVEAVS